MSDGKNEFDQNGGLKRGRTVFQQSFGDGAGELPIVPQRYRLIWAAACPWSTRVAIVRELLGLQNVISLGEVDVLRPDIDRIDWSFKHYQNEIDPVLQTHYLSESYRKADFTYDKRPTVPALVDTESGKVVNNDYNHLTIYLETQWKSYHKAGAPDLYPTDLRAQIDQLNKIIYSDINNGVYKAGLARNQCVYEKAFDRLFYRLDELDERLKQRKFLFGDRLTDSDVRLFTTLARFDTVYYELFRCNKKRIRDYEHLWRYARELYAIPAFKNHTRFDDIKKHYYTSSHWQWYWGINKGREAILPKGPDNLIWEL